MLVSHLNKHPNFDVRTFPPKQTPSDSSNSSKTRRHMAISSPIPISILTNGYTTGENDAYISYSHSPPCTMGMNAYNGDVNGNEDGKMEEDGGRKVRSESLVNWIGRQYQDLKQNTTMQAVRRLFLVKKCDIIFKQFITRHIRFEPKRSFSSCFSECFRGVKRVFWTRQK